MTDPQSAEERGTCLPGTGRGIVGKEEAIMGIIRRAALNKTSMASLKQYEKLGDRRRRLAEPSTEPAEWVSWVKPPVLRSPRISKP
jgi:hypothetical protein